MQAAGFKDYSQFIRSVFGAVQAHADTAGWLPVYWNIADVPLSARRATSSPRAGRRLFSPPRCHSLITMNRQFR
jgi:hypothetical protein